jgi:hypothetical protein
VSATAQRLHPSSGLEILEALTRAAESAVVDLVERSAVRFEDINAGGGGAFFVGWNDWQWAHLPDEALPFVGPAREAHRTWLGLAMIAFRKGASSMKPVEELSEWLQRLIDQPNGTLPRGAPGRSIEEIVGKHRQHVETFLGAVKRLSTAHGKDEQLLVADTSALLDRPDLQDWKLDGTAWTVVLVSQVLSELDEKKRDPRTADAANKISRQVDSFDGRGDTFTGVRLAGKLSYRDIPISPNMEETLPWLRADTPDDIIIASALELVTADLRSRVAVLASDRNVRIKARRAGLSTVATSQL